jgi:DNA (cytosine-5)-methyltransferase 1
MKVISLFTGVGGLDFGFEAAGFDVAIAVELDKVACGTIRLNRDWKVLTGDIHDVKSRQILRVGGLGVGEADALIGGPPCQPFSKSSYWITGDTARLDDPRADTLAAYLRVLRDTLPRTFLLENVHGIAFKGKDEGLRLLLRGIEGINRDRGTNYCVAVQKLNAAAYGVPQLRERVFLVGDREGKRFIFPQPTHGPVISASSAIEPYVTSWEAIGDLPQDHRDPALVVNGRWGDLLPSIPEGENYLWHTPRGNGMPLFGWRTRYWSFLLKLAKNMPSWTIQAQPGSAIGPFHWRNRRLSSQELCRLQSFPDGLRFACGRTDVQRMLGNAVPSLLAEVIAREMRRQLLGSPVRRGLRLVRPRKLAIPRPERVQRVVAKYHHLAGDHPSHPGEGKGLGAARRVSETAEFA